MEILTGIFRKGGRVLAAAFFLFVLFSSLSYADIFINVLAVNGSDQPQTKTIEFSLPGELKPDDIIDNAGLKLDYDFKDAGYFLHSDVLLGAKETRTFRVRVRDVWVVKDADIALLREDIERSFKEMGNERGPANAEKLRQKLLKQVESIVEKQDQSNGSIDSRIDGYRNNVQAIAAVRAQAKLIDYWSTDASTDKPLKSINFFVQVENPGDKTKKVKQQHYLPVEVKPEYVIDRQEFEIRFDQKKGQYFLFKEDDFAPGEKRKVPVVIQDVWFIPDNETVYIRDHAQYAMGELQKSKYVNTAKVLFNDIINNLDLIEALQKMQQPNIEQHIGAYRLNATRFETAKKDLDALEKLLSRFRADREKSKIKNIMQKIQTLKSLAKVSDAMFDKKPTVNAAWKLISSVMLFLAFFTIIYFVVWLLRSSKEKKQEDIKYGQKKGSS
ncbi:MAG: hypothetical protein WCI27_00925 [Candidatus Omnitrophota bacterium]